MGPTRSLGPRPGPSYAEVFVSEEPVRNIHDELYRETRYDAIWRLSNAGFVIRIGDAVVFIDAVFTSPLPEYQAERQAISETGEPLSAVNEMRLYDRPENILRETHALPLRADQVERADYVLVTHDHGDHIDPGGLAKLAHLEPTILAPRSCHPDLLDAELPAESLVEARFGDRHEADGFSITVIAADHGTSVGACGYLIETEHGTIYHPGDGKFDQPAKAAIAAMSIDYLLVPITDPNLGAGFAALLTHMLQPRVVIPCHYGYTYPPVRSQGGHPAEFVTALAARNYKLPFTDIAILSPGGRVVLA